MLHESTVEVLMSLLVRVARTIISMDFTSALWLIDWIVGVKKWVGNMLLRFTFVQSSPYTNKTHCFSNITRTLLISPNLFRLVKIYVTKSDYSNFEKLSQNIPEYIFFKISEPILLFIIMHLLLTWKVLINVTENFSMRNYYWSNDLFPRRLSLIRGRLGHYLF